MAIGNNKESTEEVNVGSKLIKRKPRKKPDNPGIKFEVILFLGAMLCVYLFVFPTHSTTKVESAPPQPIHETIIIDFTDQDVPIHCRSFNSNYDPISWEGKLTIRVMDIEKKYQTVGDRLFILPVYSAYDDVRPPDARNFREETECYIGGIFKYTVSASGKTVEDGINLDYNDCKRIFGCNIQEKIIGKFS